MKRTSTIMLSRDRVYDLTRSLKLGDIVCGTVKVRMQKNRYLIKVNQSEIIAEYNGFLKKDSQIRARVQRIHPYIEFKILNNAALTIDFASHIASCADFLKRCQEQYPVLVPHVADLWQDVRKSLQILQANMDIDVCNKFLKTHISDEIQAFDSHLIKALQDTLFVAHKERSGLVLESLLDVSERIADFCNAEKVSDIVLQNSHALRIALERSYLSFSLERVLNTKSAYTQNEIIYSQLILPREWDVQPYTFLIHPNGKKTCIRIISDQDWAHTANIVYDAQKNVLYFDKKNAVAHDVLEYITLHDTAGGGFKMTESTQKELFENDFFQDTQFFALHIQRPIGFNFVV